MIHIVEFFITQFVLKNEKTNYQLSNMFNTEGWDELTDGLYEYTDDLYIEIQNNFNYNIDESYIDVIFNVINEHRHWYYDIISEYNFDTKYTIQLILSNLVENNATIQQLYPQIDWDSESNSIYDILYDMSYSNNFELVARTTKISLLKDYKKQYPKHYHRYMMAYNKKYRSAAIIQKNFKFARYQPSIYKIGNSIEMKNLADLGINLLD